jgi:hypothetical protein
MKRKKEEKHKAKGSPLHIDVKPHRSPTNKREPR